MPLLIKSSHIWFQTPLNLSEGFFQEKNKDWFNAKDIKEPNLII